jgi:hypothetical protein
MLRAAGLGENQQMIHSSWSLPANRAKKPGPIACRTNDSDATTTIEEEAG